MIRNTVIPTPSRRSAVVSAVGVCLGILFIVAVPPAGADGVRPSNFESVVDSVDPSTPTVRVEVVGGDSFLRVTADPGTEVLIPGYDDESYLRITSDGTVEQNVVSPATYLNTERNGTDGRFPAGVSSGAEPEWEGIGTGGQVAWHDHRIHWMLSEPPPVGTDGVVQSWVLPLMVDGREVTIEGRLLRLGNVVPWAGIVALIAAIAAVALARRDTLRAPLLLGAALVAMALAAGTNAINPPGAEASPLPLILPAVATVLAAVALVAPLLLPNLLSRVRGLALPLATAAALIGWVVPQIGVLWMPVVPSAWATWIARAGTGGVLGVAIGVALAILLRPVATRTVVARPTPRLAQ